MYTDAKQHAKNASAHMMTKKIDIATKMMSIRFSGPYLEIWSIRFLIFSIMVTYFKPSMLTIVPEPETVGSSPFHFSYLIFSTRFGVREAAIFALASASA